MIGEPILNHTSNPRPDPKSERAELPLRASLRTVVLTLVTSFALTTISLIWGASREFTALAEVTRQVEVAGRLRMLSQHVAFLTHQAKKGGATERTQLENAIGEFDAKLAD